MKPRRIPQIALSVCIVLFAGYTFPETDTAVPDAPVISRILIEIKDFQGDKTELIEIAKNLIFLREGGRFSPEKMESSIEALKICKKFKGIHADSSEDGDKMSLLFQLTPFRRIKNIEIDNASPFFERDILNAMTIYIGDAFARKRLAEQPELIERIFKEEGFSDPKVEVTATKDPEDGCLIVNVRIVRGDYYKVRHLEISGNEEFSDARLKLRMKTWAAKLLPGGPGRFVEKSLREDVKNLTEYYRKKGYPDVKIDSEAEKDSETKAVSVLITINEGKEYDIEFDGNEEFWDFTLKKDLVLFTDGNKNDFGIRKSTRKIKERYRQAGYLNARVKTEEDETQTDKTVRELRFVIEEGPRSIVSSIQIAGNQAFDDERIRKQMLTQLPGILADGAFVPEVLEEDILAIQSLYLNHGYMNTKVTKTVEQSEDNQVVSVHLDIEEGVRTLVSSVKITGNTVIREKEAYKSLQVKEGEAFRKELVQNDENTLASMISEKGRPHIRVSGDISFSEDQSEAAVTYKADEGPYVGMGQVYFTGNFRTKEKILLNELEVKPEAPFSLVKMLETQRNIRNMHIFESVQFKAIGLKEKEDKVHLFVETEERKPYFVQVGAGYDTRRSFFAHAKSGDRNLFGTNKSIWLEGEVSEILYHAEAGITEPRLFGSRFSATFGLFGEEKEEFNQDFGVKSFGASLGFSRKWSKHFGTSLNFKFEQRDQFGRDSTTSDVYDSDEFETRRIFVTTPAISYDTRDSFIRPKKGLFSTFSVDISQGLENSVDNFLKYRLDTRFYWTPAERLTLACHGRFGYIDPYGSQEKVADDQLFFIGGTSDVRGFKENLLRYDTGKDPMGGQTSLLGSLEARIDLGLNFELTTFYDIGKLSDTFGESDSKDIRSSAGLGLRYSTPVGPIGFLYGFKLDREEGESPGRLHFSMGYTF
ncbi:outer membrane protein assembly factor BamA [Desulfococcaceae bacterium HSG8]|nr:outer membrane protein assembly factor BamA [Desulfococcaceae bacterium HSG8]